MQANAKHLFLSLSLAADFLTAQGWLAVCAVAACAGIALLYARSMHSLPDRSVRRFGLLD